MVLGSGSIVSQVAQENLVDEYQTVLVPIVLGSGRTLFERLDHRQPLQLTQCRAFSNGNVVLWHKAEPDMSRLILQMQMSVDGYMSADTDIDWQVWDWGDPWTWDKGLKRRFNAVFDTVGCILLSRRMAERLLDHWDRVARDHASEPDYVA